MKRRYFFRVAAALPALALFPSCGRYLPAVSTASREAGGRRARVRCGEPEWPSASSWDLLKQRLEGDLIKLSSPFSSCANAPQGAACREAASGLNNGFSVGDNPALTQTSGWVDAWTSQPSAYAVAAKTTADIVAAVNFARDYNLRLVIKGGGHSYQGTSASADSLLVWTRPMNEVSLLPAFVAQGCAATSAQPAVSLGAGAMWIDAYHHVTTLAGRYVQGGGCTTVGVAGLVQSGGFSNFSKKYGTAAAGLIEAEVVTADGQVRIANACTNPDLFWALKGGGGGSFGVVTRLTLRTRELPEFFGAVFGKVKASSDIAFRALIAKVIEFYTAALFNSHWGEQMAFNANNTLDISLVFQGLSQPQAEKIWSPFIEWIGARKEYTLVDPIQSIVIPAQHFWDGDYYKQHFPGLMVSDPRPGAAKHHVQWQGDQGEAGWFIHGYQSAWLAVELLAIDQQARLVDAIYKSSRHWRVSFHFNKGLAGASENDIRAARDTAMNPAALNAFALAIIAGGGSPEFPGMAQAAPDLSHARDDAAHIGKAMDELLKVAPGAGSYVSESDYFKSDWQTAFWGANYPQLAAIKTKYDPDGFFFVHHGVGSEGWDLSGFTRLNTDLS